MPYSLSPTLILHSNLVENTSNCEMYANQCQIQVYPVKPYTSSETCTSHCMIAEYLLVVFLAHVRLTKFEPSPQRASLGARGLFFFANSGLFYWGRPGQIPESRDRISRGSQLKGLTKTGNHSWNFDPCTLGLQRLKTKRSWRMSPLVGWIEWPKNLLQRKNSHHWDWTFTLLNWCYCTSSSFHISNVSSLCGSNVYFSL